MSRSRAIGLTANIGLAYTLKFLWSPLLDRRPPPGRSPRFGRRRGWLLAIQPLLAFAAVLLALSDPARAPAARGSPRRRWSRSSPPARTSWSMPGASRASPQRLQGAAMAAYVWGYRVALLISGAGAIGLAEPSSAGTARCWLSRR